MPRRPKPSLGWVKAGAEVEVEWVTDDWWPAEVVEVDGKGAERTILVTYPGWSRAKHDKWISDPARVRRPLGAVAIELERVQKKCNTTEGYEIVDDELLFQVEDVVGRRVRNGVTEYRVVWAGAYKPADKRSWEPEENLPTAWIDKYESDLAASIKPTRAAAVRTPHVLKVVGGGEVCPDHAAFVIDEVAKQMQVSTKRQANASQKFQTVATVSIDERLYLALHARLRAMTAGLEGRCALAASWWSATTMGARSLRRDRIPLRLLEGSVTRVPWPKLGGVAMCTLVSTPLSSLA